MIGPLIFKVPWESNHFGVPRHSHKFFSLSTGIGAFGRRGTAFVHFCKNKSHNSFLRRSPSTEGNGENQTAGIRLDEAVSGEKSTVERGER